MASILNQLDRLGQEHPHKLLYSYLDLNGNPIECYSYASFIERTKTIAGHLRRDGRFAAEWVAENRAGRPLFKELREKGRAHQIESVGAELRAMMDESDADVAAGRTVKLFRSYNPDYPHGGQRRDFVYVRDVAEVVAWLMENEGVNGVFNLGSGEARSFKDLAEAVFRAAGREPQIEYIEMPKALRGKYQYFTEAPMERLRAAGYAGEITPLKAGIGDYVARYLSQSDPYR